MTDVASTQELSPGMEAETGGGAAAYYFDEGGITGCGDNGGPSVITAFERDVMDQFDRNLLTYQNDYAANLSDGRTFLDRDGDGWYDHIERATSEGYWIYCGNDNWVPWA